MANARWSKPRIPMVTVSLLIALVGLSTVGCKKSATPADDRPAPTVESRSPQKPAAPPVLALGEAVTNDNIQVTVLGARQVTEWTKTPKAGTRYIALRFKVKNIGSEVVFGDEGRNLQWKDPDTGMRNGPERYTGIKLAGPDNSNLDPGQEAEFEAAYQVPDGVAELEFHYVPGYNPVEKARWIVPL